MTGGADVGGYRRPGPVAGPDAVRLDLNEAPREVGAALRQALLDRFSEADWRRYPDMDGAAGRRAAAALYGWDAAGTLVGNGSGDLLAAAFRALLPRRGTVATLAPSFSLYPVLAARQEAVTAAIPLRPPAFAVDVGEAVAAASAADLVVISSPNNPTGGAVPAAVLEAVVGTGTPVVWDAAYAEFSSLDPAALLARGHPNLLVLRTLSKAWGLAGLRAGALLGAEALVERVRREMLPFGAGLAVTAAFDAATRCRAEGAEMVAEVAAERRRLAAAVAGVGGLEVAPSEANFLLLRMPGRTGPELAAALARRGIAIRVVAELAAEGWVRVTVGSSAENARFLAAAEEVIGG